MSARQRIADGLQNVLTKLGLGAERYNSYAFCPLTAYDIESAYRGSGIMRKIIDVPAFDMVRAGRDWQAEKDQIELLEAEEKRLEIRPKIRMAEVYRGLGGGALILGLPGDTRMPANLRAIGKGGLAFVHVVSRWQLTLGDMVEDAMDPLFGGPRSFEMTTTAGQITLHPSRVVCFRGDPLPGIIGTSWEDSFWGESRVARVLGAVKNSDAAQSGFAALIHKAKLTRIGIPNLTDWLETEDGENKLVARVQNMTKLESTCNASIYHSGDKDGGGEEIKDYQVTWTGMRDIMTAYDVRVAAVADIPMTRMFGVAAEGMNSSGDSQQKDWNKHIGARQELELRPCLERLDEALIPSALGSRPPEIWFEFAPLDQPSEEEEATTFDKTMDAVTKLQGTGTIPGEALAKGVQNLMSERAWIPGLDAALAEIPESERFGIEQEEDPDGVDPSAIVDPKTGKPARAAANDAAPRTLYVSRKLLNPAEFIAWAKSQGFDTTTPADELHVTICFSKQPVDWMKMGGTWEGDDKGNLTVPPGGARIVESLGDKGAVVLLFASSALSWRHEDMKRNGASFDFDEYQPHVTVTYAAPEGLDLSKVEPYRGKLVFGPEIFAEVVEDWEKGVTEQ